MSMTRQLYSLSALATELRRDRRTVAAALSGVPGDGAKQGHPAWFLTTALQALEPKPERWTAGDDDHIGPLWHFASRLDGWEELHLREKRDWPIAQVAADYKVPVET